MSSRAPSLTVKNLSNVLVEVIEWKQLGANLGMKMYKLNEIDKNNMGNVAGAKLAFIDQWLRSDVNASWEKLAKALEDMVNCETVIERINREFISGGVPSGRAVQRSAGGQGAAGYRGVVTDAAANSSVPRGAQQPVVLAEVRPEDEIRHAQRMIDNPEEEEPEGRIAKMISSFSNWSFDINYHNPEDSRNTLLHYCCLHKGDLNVIRAIVAFGADVNRHNTYSQTPLDVAKFLHKEDICKFLKEVGGVDSNAANYVNSPMQHPVQVQEGSEQEDAAREDDFGGGHLILTLDYSSTMALVQLEVLNQLERVTGKKITDMFEWIVASGVAGFLVLAMVYAKKSMSDLRRIYFRLRERVFSGQAPAERGKELEDLAVEIFGQGTRMMDIETPMDDDNLPPKVLIGAVNKTSTNLNPIFFNNYEDDLSRVHVWKVARYTCSSPLYIGECDNYIDGGAVYKNPSIFAFSVIREAYHMQSARISGVLSIGDGRLPGIPLGKLDQSNYYSHFFKSTTNTLSEEVSRAFSGICEAGGMLYQRINPLMDEYITLPEEATLEQLINAVIRTITQCQGQENSPVQEFLRSFNNVVR